MPKIPESELVINSDGSIYHLSLKPEHLADTIFLVGDPGRVHLVSQHFDKIDFEMNKREFITHVGKLKGERVMVMSTGMSVSNVEIALLELDALANIDFTKREVKEKRKQLKIIRIGTSGGLQEDIPVGSHVISQYAVGFDNILNFYELPQSKFETHISTALKNYLEIDFLPYTSAADTTLYDKYKSGMIAGFTATTPGFYAPQGRKLTLPIKYPKMVDRLTSFHFGDHWITNFEMETSGIYAIGGMLGHHVLSTNAILANRPKGEFAKDTHKVVDELIQKIISLF